MTILEEILREVRGALSSTRSGRPVGELRAMLADAPPVRSFSNALTHSFGLIAEVKKKSPSVGPMRAQNFEEAPLAYEGADIVRALSVLTNSAYFGMSIESLGDIRARVSKPILRKEFILDEYQIREARAFGADAILLMANVLDAPRLRGFSDLAHELGMEVLFEVHTAQEIQLLPPDAKIIGINSRKFKTKHGFVGKSGASEQDFTVDLSVFQLNEELPPGTLRVAESGIAPSNIKQVSGVF
ncbi:MAG: indole-3-glycerol-phosphate synthase TrpC, partial [Verrucomicrobia bacterium]